MNRKKKRIAFRPSVSESQLEERWVPSTAGATDAPITISSASAVATPLALVLAELLQNALQHGLAQIGPDQAPGLVGLLEVSVDRTQERLTVIVQDNGVGLPEEFDLDSATSLGLQIVRTLVVSELGGRLEVKPRAGGGTKAVVDLPLDAGAPLSARTAPIRSLGAADPAG